MGTCGNCKHWDTTGFGLPDKAEVGQCKLVARHWFPTSPEKPIAMNGIEHTRWPVSMLIAVITRREFGCNQFSAQK